MPYSRSTLITIGGLIIVAVGIAYLIYRVYKLEKPSPGNCDYVKSTNPDVKWSSDCSYVQELLLTTAIQTPSEPLHLTKFTSAPSLGPAWSVDVYYKYKYVNSKTGEYGKSSKWISSPITANSTKLPCGPEGCTNVQFTGKDSCRSNLPQLSVNKLSYPVGSDFYANVHRYVATHGSSSPSDSEDGKIVGMLYPDGSGGGTFIDTSSSPCKEIPCGNITGC
jgi:hypothetical protein